MPYVGLPPEPLRVGIFAWERFRALYGVHSVCSILAHRDSQCGSRWALPIKCDLALQVGPEEG
jgi:hypothetical protein